MSTDPAPLSRATPVRALVAELLGTAGLLAVVVGSGIMGQRLSGGNEAIALLANALATGAGLLALIWTLGPLSGAHMNPAVTLAAAWTGRFPRSRVVPYVMVQLLAAPAGVMLAHAMFRLPLWSPGTHARTGSGLWLAEVVSTAGLVSVVLLTGRSRPSITPLAVAAQVVAGYWFTSSTHFANPAVTVARALTDTFTGIRPLDVPAFVLAQFMGAGVASLLVTWFECVPASVASPDLESPGETP